MNEGSDFLSLSNRIQIKSFRNAEKLLKKNTEGRRGWDFHVTFLCLQKHFHYLFAASFFVCIICIISWKLEEITQNIIN